MPGIIDVYILENSSRPVTLTVTVGYACKGATVVKLDHDQQNGIFDDSFTMDLGPNNELIGKDLLVRSIVTKLIPGENHSSVTITLEGGVEKKDYPMEDNSTDNPVPLPGRITLII
jgi:hypothetical protein